MTLNDYECIKCGESFFSVSSLKKAYRYCRKCRPDNMKQAKHLNDLKEVEKQTGLKSLTTN